ncbi:MAG TPA: alpha/beta hydrolase [Spirochaetota bacterium]|nr:alpha/beta hydrolase [Spirochaetota bacterium]HPC40667.1 alpha/beta hydrolase [Spirochaetota bacterium]HPL18271.1 alpha/beta hydrolase [Spirochaetota bacterium]HQF09425.1 alpha/beta hydrolase [Spirochaetota bacterium]HQH97961.1 alpha/beta hydrolase [Spirochaetota bacterium]
MKSDTFTFKASDGTKIAAYRWLPGAKSNIKAAVQIAHGMAEHAARYERFAKELVKAGYAVYANDHRGHGKTAGALENVGYLADENGWDKVVDDMLVLTKLIKKENPKVPIFLIGHSMGSFLSRQYAMLHGNEIKGLILSGTGGDPGLLGKIGLFIAKREAKSKGKKTKSPLLDKLSFGAFNKAFKPNRTNFDWLSRDNAEVDKYIADPYCGDVFTAGFFCDMLEGIAFINDARNIDRIPKELPIYLFSGSLDPVGANTKGVLQVYNALVKAGIRDVTYRFYQDARHETLNETNREEVFRDVIEWLNKHRPKK